jgi:flavin reductase (DIM6/NTAB) family NADH-FMN oxidoreductase RutF
VNLNREEIGAFEQRYRTTFVNSLAGFRQVVLVGTKSADGISNLTIFNSLMHIGAHPPLYGILNRPDSVQRDTLQNILETKEYTLNFVRATVFEKAHQTSARYEKDVSEFAEVGFEEHYLEGCVAPFVKEAVVKIAMKLEEIIPIPLNGTQLIVGSISQLELNDGMLGQDGFVSLSEEEVLLSQGLDAYFEASSIGRLPYAKPGKTFQ